ncbi:carboxy-S-adenosyl-L-methionine synthase [Arenicella chitinivorans]|uniref:Carboxy-S-adenosyl-L-methionine synthase n=1 Tax=Arenicella chitinivorans TaxID=1329800 RepID=A0A918RQR8_9GAMM|nr:carboxy-S-adenosyl-L-methionine synthase CmoA [Arenicella chitinivorans]GHA07356.1 carboxy-S-adenosyl-L-methionine synthase [Arenicella chitinivorans]
MTDQKDTLFKTVDALPGSFKFDARVAAVFEDMISRSVPGYQQILQLLPTLTRTFFKPDSTYYDLGCSLGAGLLAMHAGFGERSAQLIGVDNSSAMLTKAQQNLSHLDQETLRLSLQDLQDTEFDRAQMILMNFTLQFIPLADRHALMARVYASLHPGGVLVLSEKLKFSDPHTAELMAKIHYQYKKDQDYSELEISKKRDAIEDVLVPETLEDHIARLHSAGFKTVTPWIQNLQFISLLAVK